MRISFDFDGTLTTIQAQDLIPKLRLLGCEIIIVTSRNENNNLPVFDFADDLCIKEVHFTNFQSKWLKLKDLNVEVHIDDDEIELEEIQENLIDCKGFNIKSKDLEELLLIFVKNKKNE